MEVVEGSAVKLKCRVTGEPDPSVEWFLDDEKVEADKTIQIGVVGDMHSLTIPEASLDDEGEYKCVATNDAGSASSTAELLVNEAPTRPEFEQKMADLDVTEGERARFEVTVTGSPTPEVEWFKGSDKLKSQGRFEVGEEGESGFYLAIDAAEKKDAGSYKCVATNENGKTTCRGELEVKDKLAAPKFVGEEPDAPVALSEGSELTLEVTVRGSPAPQVDWRKDNLTVTKDSRTAFTDKGGTHGLTVFRAKQTDSGLYKCTAKNKAGSASRTFQVIVEGM